MSGVNYHARRAGKSLALTARHRLHPLEFESGFQFIELDKRFGNVAVYRTVTKNISEIMGHRGEWVPHTDLRYRMLNADAARLNEDVALIAWIRRSNKEELGTAVATLLMLGKNPVIVRAFEP